MRWVMAVFVVTFALSLAGPAVAAPLNDAPGRVAAAPDPGADLRSADAALPFVASDVGGTTDDGLSTAVILLLAAGGVLAFGGAGFTMRRVTLVRRHAVG